MFYTGKLSGDIEKLPKDTIIKFQEARVMTLPGRKIKLIFWS